MPDLKAKFILDYSFNCFSITEKKKKNAIQSLESALSGLWDIYFYFFLDFILCFYMKIPFYKYNVSPPEDVRKYWGRDKFISNPWHSPALFHKKRSSNRGFNKRKGERKRHILIHWQYVEKLLSASEHFLLFAIHLKLLLKAFEQVGHWQSLRD